MEVICARDPGRIPKRPNDPSTEVLEGLPCLLWRRPEPSAQEGAKQKDGVGHVLGLLRREEYH